MADVSKTILVTGAGSGIGAALCRRIAAPGMRMLMHTGSHADRLAKVAAACTAKGAQCHLETGDMADAELPTRLVETCVKTFGSVEAIVHCAGFADRRKLGELPDDGFEKSFDVIARAMFKLANAALPHLAVAGPRGRVIGVSSFLAHVHRLGGDAFPASAASKAALEGLIRSMASQFASHGVTVNCVIPGYIQKEPGTPSSLDEAGWQRALARVPLGRLGQPDEVAAVIAFLLGPDAAYITGQSIHINGGLTL